MKDTLLAETAPNLELDLFSQLERSSLAVARRDDDDDDDDDGDDDDDDDNDDGGRIIRGTRRSDRLRGGDGNDRIVGLGGNDSLFGDDDDDLLRGDSGSDRLYGGDDDDTLIGGAGNDILVGGDDTDTLTGGLGRDLFVLASGDDDDDDRDIIRDFRNGQDRLRLSGRFDFDDLTIFQRGRSTIINADDDQIAALIGVRANTITSVDFA